MIQRKGGIKINIQKIENEQNSDTVTGTQPALGAKLDKITCHVRDKNGAIIETCRQMVFI